MIIRRIFTTLVLIAGLQLSGSALAQPAASPSKGDTDAAKQHYQHGQKLVTAKEYRRALAEFSAGYELSHKPAFLFNMAECARLSEDTEKARYLYERYLKEAPQGTLAGNARQRLADLPPAQPTVSKTAPVTTPQNTPVTSAPIAVPAQPVNLRISSSPATSESTTLTANLTPKKTSRPIWKKWPFWVGVGAAAVLGTVVVIAATGDNGESCGSNCVRF